MVLQTGYSAKPSFKNIHNVINFDAPDKYNSYKESGSSIEDEGVMLTLITPPNTQNNKEKTDTDRIALY